MDLVAVLAVLWLPLLRKPPLAVVVVIVLLEPLGLVLLPPPPSAFLQPVDESPMKFFTLSNIFCRCWFMSFSNA